MFPNKMMRLNKITLLLTCIILFSPSVKLCQASDLYQAIVPLGEIARKAIPQQKPGRLRGYLLPVGQKNEQSIKDLTEALKTEKGRTGYFALLSYDQTNLVTTILEVLPHVEKNNFHKLTIIYVGYKQHKDIIHNAFLHTGAAFIFAELNDN